MRNYMLGMIMSLRTAEGFIEEKKVCRVCGGCSCGAIHVNVCVSYGKIESTRPWTSATGIIKLTGRAAGSPVNGIKREN
jgi:hypothetical protein